MLKTQVKNCTMSLQATCHYNLYPHSLFYYYYYSFVVTTRDNTTFT